MINIVTSFISLYRDKPAIFVGEDVSTPHLTHSRSREVRKNLLLKQDQYARQRKEFMLWFSVLLSRDLDTCVSHLFDTY